MRSSAACRLPPSDSPDAYWEGVLRLLRSTWNCCRAKGTVLTPVVRSAAVAASRRCRANGLNAPTRRHPLRRSATLEASAMRARAVTQTVVLLSDPLNGRFLVARLARIDALLPAVRAHRPASLQRLQPVAGGWRMADGEFTLTVDKLSFNPAFYPYLPCRSERQESTRAYQRRCAPSSRPRALSKVTSGS